MTDTPRTDARMARSHKVEMAEELEDLCRTLEREVMELREALSDVRRIPLGKALEEFLDPITGGYGLLVGMAGIPNQWRNRIPMIAQESFMAGRRSAGADSPGETFTAPSTERLSPARADTPRLPSDEPQSVAQSAPATPHTEWCACRFYGPFCIYASSVEPFRCQGLPKQQLREGGGQ